jgi:hypothetical protein
VDLPQDIRSDILAFYRDLSLPIATKSNPSDWVRLQDELSHLKAVNLDLSAVNSKVPAAVSATAAK